MWEKEQEAVFEKKVGVYGLWVNVLITKIELTVYICLEVEEKDKVVWIEEA